MSLIIHIDAPFCTIEEFSRRTGLSPNAIRHKVANGEFPTVDTRLDRTRRGAVYINLVKLAQMADQAEFNHPNMNEE